MNIANKITVIRIFLVPFFVVFLIYSHTKQNLMFNYIALAIFILSALADLADGRIARRLNQQTHLGSFLDPLADKLLLIFAFLILTYIGKIPLFFGAIFIFRELLLIISWFTLFVVTGKFEVVPTFAGKLAIAAEMLLIILILLQIPYSYLRVLLWLAVGIVLYSTLEYLIKGQKALESRNRI